MPVGIAAAGVMGIALETTPNTYAAPTKFVPYVSNSLGYMQNIIQRRPIRQSADVVGLVAGDVHVEGDVSIEALDDVLPYFLHCSRATVVKSGSTPNFVYTYIPSNAAQAPNKTMSITLVRNNQVFGFTGLVLSSWNATLNDGLLMFNGSMLGSDEATQTTPTGITWPTTTPFGPGQYRVEVPTATQVFDTDTFTFSVEDNGAAQNRMKDTGRGAQFISFGERTTQLTLERDFIDRTDFDAFKAMTQRSITVSAVKGTNNSITFLAPNTTASEYPINEGGQGDLLRVAVVYICSPDGAGKTYQITIKTQENIT